MLFHDDGTSERVVFVRGKVSKKYNPHEVWLRLTREERAQWQRNWLHETPQGCAYRQHEFTRSRQAYEADNATLRNSRERKLFKKLRLAGVPLLEARLQSGWGVTVGPGVQPMAQAA